MALLQISEPGQSTNPHEHRLAAGIDLGTTNSLVASVRSGVADTFLPINYFHLSLDGEVETTLEIEREVIQRALQIQIEPRIPELELAQLGSSAA